MPAPQTDFPKATGPGVDREKEPDKQKRKSKAKKEQQPKLGQDEQVGGKVKEQGSAATEKQAEAPTPPAAAPRIQPPRLGAAGAEAVAVLKELAMEAMRLEEEEEELANEDEHRASFSDAKVAECEGTWKPPTWQMEEAFSQSLGRVVINIFNDVLNLPKTSEARVSRHLGRLEPGELSRLLKEALIAGDCTTKLAKELGKQLEGIARAEALTGDEMNAKFAMCPNDKFEMVFGDKATYLKGLEPRIGLPSAKTLQAIVEEHCRAEDSNIPWTTGNYGITTTSREELLIVVKTLLQELEELQRQRYTSDLPQLQEEELWTPIEAGLLELQALVKDFDLTSIEWKAETKNGDHPRATHRARNLLLALMEKNAQLKALDGSHPLLRLEEALMCNLYTGPLFEKYNQVHRGGSLTGSNNKFMERRFQELCCGNRYTTSQFVLTSGMIKLSVLSKTVDLYRGVGKGLLPMQFWKPDTSGSRGGVELGFMSATTDRRVACQYTRGSAIQTVFEMSTGMIDNGAELDWISQYPHEKEICFPPLTALEVVKTRCEGPQLCVSLRLNLNLTNDTIEKVVGKRKEVIHSLCHGLQQEVTQFLSGPSSLWKNMLRSISPSVSEEELRQLKVVARDNCGKKLLALQEREAEYYNSDSNFLEVVQQSLSCASSAKFGSGKVFLEIAEVLDAKAAAPRSWKDKLFPMAKRLLEDDFEARNLQIETSYQKVNLAIGNDVEWVFNALGFKLWQGLWVEGGPDLLWTDFVGKTYPALPQGAGRPLPSDCWLMELEGSRELDQAARGLCKRWNKSGGNYDSRKLSARFVVAQPRQQKELRDWWLQSSRSGKLEAASVRLQRIWAMVPPLPFDEEWLSTQQLSDEGVKEWAAAFRGAAAAGIFLPVPEILRFSKGDQSVLLNNCPDLWSGLASSPELKVLILSGCQLSSSFAESFTIPLSDFGDLGQKNPFPSLQELLLDDNPDLGMNLAHPDSFARSLALFSNLEVLNLESCGLDSSFFRELTTSIRERGVALEGGGSCWPKLRTLRLSKNPRLGSGLREPSSFVQGLAALPALEALHLESCGLDAQIARALGATLLERGQTVWPKLQTLVLRDNPRLGGGASEEPTSSFAEGLTRLGALKVLDVELCGLDSSFALALSASILEVAGGVSRRWPKMKKLTLSANSRLGEKLQEPSLLTDALASLPELKEVSLADCGLKNDFADALLSTFSGVGNPEKQAEKPQQQHLQPQAGDQQQQQQQPQHGQPQRTKSWQQRPWPKLEKLRLPENSFGRDSMSKLMERLSQERPRVELCLVSADEKAAVKTSNNKSNKSNSSSNNNNNNHSSGANQRWCRALCLRSND